MARKLRKDDYEKFDYILAMESRNIPNILRIIEEDKDNKVCRLLDYSESPRDIADPYYTGNFDRTYDDILEGCITFLENVLK